MAPLMPSEDPNSPKTRLLTFLNVSASRSNKKRRLDALLAPEDGPQKKFNARKFVVVEEEDKGEGSGSESDESDEEASDTDPGYTSYFGPTSPIPTDVPPRAHLHNHERDPGTFSSSIPTTSPPTPTPTLGEQSPATHLHPRLRTHWTFKPFTLTPRLHAQHSSSLALLASRKDVYHGHLAGNIGFHETLTRCTAGARQHGEGQGAGAKRYMRS